MITQKARHKITTILHKTSMVLVCLGLLGMLVTFAGAGVEQAGHIDAGEYIIACGLIGTFGFMGLSLVCVIADVCIED